MTCPAESGPVPLFGDLSVSYMGITRTDRYTLGTSFLADSIYKSKIFFSRLLHSTNSRHATPRCLTVVTEPRGSARLCL